jgi:hypothetical protein
MLAAAALATLAIVTQDAVSLRATPRDSGTTQAQLWQGDVLEVRGERMDYLQVWDHRRERAGYVRASQVRVTHADASEAPELLAVLRFVRDTPGSEALGISYAAAYLRAAPASAITAEPFDAMGSMAERLARRGSAKAGISDTKLAAHLDGVGQFGVRIMSYEQEGAVRLCYDGEAFRRVLAMPQATPEQRAHAALGLTRPDCADPALRASERDALDTWRNQVLDRVTPADLAALPEVWKNRLQMRRAGLEATLAFSQARRDENAQASGQRALQALAAVNKLELSDDDQADYNDAAMRVGASRWAAEAPGLAPTGSGKRPTLLTQPGRPGETCVLLIDAQHEALHPLLRQCTWGVAWLASASGNAAGTALALAVQPLATWRELWLMKQTATGWLLEVLPPAAGNPLGADLGVVELAGWVPEGPPRVLLAREARVDGKWIHRFEVARIDTLATDKQAGTPQQLSLFQRWQDPAWKRVSVSLR